MVDQVPMANMPELLGYLPGDMCIETGKLHLHPVTISGPNVGASLDTRWPADLPVERCFHYHFVQKSEEE